MTILEFIFRILGNVIWIVIASLSGQFADIALAIANIVQLISQNLYLF